MAWSRASSFSRWKPRTARSSACCADGSGPDGQADAAPIRVCVDSARTVRSRPGITVERIGGWESRTQEQLSPPRLKHRRLLLEILRDVDAGAYSVLERHYLVRVERPHGLPTAQRQRRVRQGKHPAFRDVDYVDLGAIVELDGRLGHEEAPDRWADLDRDLLAVVAGELTLRAGWGQVLDPCRLAAIVGGVLVARGWVPTLRGCSETCRVNDLATNLAPGAGEVAAS